MAKQYVWTKIVDDFTFFRCINLDDVQRKHVAKMASNVWKRATEETRISRNNYLVPEYKHLLYVKRYGAHSESELVNNDTSQMQN